MQNYRYFTMQDLTHVHCGLALQKRPRPIFDHIFLFQHVGRFLKHMAHLFTPWRGDNKNQSVYCELLLVLWEKERDGERESERAHIHQAKPIDTQSLEQGALEEAGGPQQRGGISSGRTSEEALLFVWFPEACTFLSVSFNPLSDVVHQHMSTLNLGLLTFTAAFL